MADRRHEPGQRLQTILHQTLMSSNTLTSPARSLITSPDPAGKTAINLE